VNREDVKREDVQERLRRIVIGLKETQTKRKYLGVNLEFTPE